MAKLGAVKLWDEVISTYLTKNKSEEGILRHKPLYVDSRGFYSGVSNVSYIYTIASYPKELEVSFRTTLRNACQQGVRMSFISTFEPHEINWNSFQVKSKLNTWKNIEIDEDEVDEYNLHKNIEGLDNQQWKKDSLRYINEALTKRKRKTFKYRSILILSGVRGEEFNKSISDLLSISSSMGIKLNRVLFNVQDYLECFSPFSLCYNDKVTESVNCSVLTDELLARMNTYSQGKIGRGGEYWGTDIYSMFPCFKFTKKTSETPECWLITAEAGGGKSFFVKVLLVQLLANKSYNITVLDVDGVEYIDLLDYFTEESGDGIILNMAEGTGFYLNTVPIVRTWDDELDAEMYTLCSSFTLSVFKTLLGDTPEVDEWIDIVINDAVSMTYMKAGVTNDMSTWKKSNDLTLFDVYAQLKDLVRGEVSENSLSLVSYRIDDDQTGTGFGVNDVNRLVSMNEGYQNAVELAIAKLARYFEEGGTKSSVFSQPASIEEVVTAKLVICSLGMAGRSPQTVDKVQMSLMQVYASIISHLRSIFSKNEGKYNIKLWEEFQRWGGFPGSDVTISTAITGGRKLGDVNIIVTNVVKELLCSDRFKIFDNVTSIAIGCIGDAKVRQDLCERLTITNMLPELDKLVTENKDISSYVEGDISSTNPYNKAFLIGLDKTAFALSKMMIPPELQNSDLFRTGVKLQDED